MGWNSCYLPFEKNIARNIERLKQKEYRIRKKYQDADAKLWEFMDNFDEDFSKASYYFAVKQRYWKIHQQIEVERNFLISLLGKKFKTGFVCKKKVVA